MVKKTVIYAKAISILFIIGGLLFLSRTIQGTQYLDIILAPVGVILIFFTTLTQPKTDEKDMYSALAFSIWIIASYFITIRTESELLFIFILVGFLLIQELSQDTISRLFQKRLSIVLVFFFVIFLGIIVNKIQIILTG